MKRFVLRGIACYRRSGGGRLWFGVDCNFVPSCSEYTLRAIARFGLYRGAVLGWHRLRRCKARDSICKCLEPVPRKQC